MEGPGLEVLEELEGQGGQGGMVRSPWSDKKVSGRVGHNSVALPKAEGQRSWRVTEYALP